MSIVYNAMYLVILSCLLEGIPWLRHSYLEASWRILLNTTLQFS